MILRGHRLALALVALGVLVPGDLTRAEILGADLQVNGLACPFCAFGIEKKLLDVDGVKSVDVRLDEGRLRLQLERGNSATTAALEAAVEKAGFELAGLAIQVRGTLDIRETETWLEAHTGQRFMLLEADRDGTRPLSPAVRERLPVDDQRQVVAAGHVLGSADALRLLVDPSRSTATKAP